MVLNGPTIMDQGTGRARLLKMNYSGGNIEVTQIAITLSAYKG